MVHWPKNLDAYFDSCHLYDDLSFYNPQFPRRLDVDMLTIDSAIIRSYHNFGIVIRTVSPRMPTAAHEPILSLPISWKLSTNYPNPFNPATTFRLSIPRRSHVSARVFDAVGRLVAVLISDQLEAGDHEIEWNGTNFDGHPMSSGVYVIRLTAFSEDGALLFTTSRKMALLK